VKTERFRVKSGSQPAIVDITDRVKDFVSGEGDGLVNVSLPHATAGLVLIELHSGSEEDLWDRLEFLLPKDHRYRHSHGSRGHGASHVMPAFISPTLTLPVVDGAVSLGTWQSIALVDPNVDNMTRDVLLAFLPASP
jgi:secondary thiamine-phosphate synthase enzyme